MNLRPHDPEPCALAKLSYAPSLLKTSGIYRDVLPVSTED